MKPLQIDFAPRSGWLHAGTDRGRRPLWAAACIVLLILLIASATTAWRLQQERAEVSARVATLQAALNVSEEGEADNATATADTVESVLVANRHLNFPWANMLGILEHNVQPEVSLVSLEMGVLRQSNKLVIESTDVPHALSYLDALRDESVYAGMNLTRQETVVADGGTRVRFTLEAPVAMPEAARRSGEGR